MFTKEKKETKGSKGRSILLDQWSSGYFSVVGLLLDCCDSHRVICIDEPELHLEPRILRKVIDILMWMYSRDGKLEEVWKKWLNESTFKDKDNLENNKNFKPLSSKQIFIASHSPVLINEFLSRDKCSIFEFDNEYQDSSYKVCYGKDIKLQNVKQDSLVSVVRKIPIDQCPHSILDNLGAQGSDLLQTNGIIWVEGPSDIIYIKKWLEMYVVENNLRGIEQGIHYQFQMFGGVLLDKYSLIVESNCGLDELDKLIDMFSFSRNSFIIIDSDAEKVNNQIVDKSTFENAKKYIDKKITKLIAHEFNLGLWYEQENEKLKTIEHYIPKVVDSRMSSKDNERLLSTGKKGNRNKVENARRRVADWNKRLPRIKLSDFEESLEIRIKELYQTIHKWNE